MTFGGTAMFTGVQLGDGAGFGQVNGDTAGIDWTAKLRDTPRLDWAELGSVIGLDWTKFRGDAGFPGAWARAEAGFRHT